MVISSTLNVLLGLSIPNFSESTPATRMFFNCSNLKGNSAVEIWDVSNVNSTVSMFHNCSQFNINLGKWDMTNTIIERMFQGATEFNNGGSNSINNWNISNTNLIHLFDFTNFNQPLNKWDVSGVSNMSFMFRGTPFNQNIGDWDVSNVTNMNSMFNGSSFNQNIGDWDVSNVSSFLSFMGGNIGLSVENYDNLLNGWSQLTLENDVEIHINQNYSSEGEIARTNIINNFNWTINDFGLI